MFHTLNEEMTSIKGDLRQKNKLVKQLDDYKQELSEIENTIDTLTKQLKEEEKDVKKLEGLTITNLLSTIVGTKNEKLDKEEEEVYAVQLKLEEARKTKAEIEEDIEEIRQKLSSINSTEMDYKQLLKKKAELIKDQNSTYSLELSQLEEKEADLQAYLKELREAESAGNRVKNALQQAIRSLESAKGWGTWDMVGGGMISSAIKHDHIDKASTNIHIAQRRMRQFQKELLDVNESASMNIDMSGLLKFADFFFDGFIVDWMVQGKINDSLRQTENQLYSVKQIIANLVSQIEKQEKELQQTKSERKQLIEQVGH